MSEIDLVEAIVAKKDEEIRRLKAELEQAQRERNETIALYKDQPVLKQLERFEGERDALREAIVGLLKGYTALRNGVGEYPWQEAIDRAEEALAALEQKP